VEETRETSRFTASPSRPPGCQRPQPTRRAAPHPPRSSLAFPEHDIAAKRSHSPALPVAPWAERLPRAVSFFGEASTAFAASTSPISGTSVVLIICDADSKSKNTFSTSKRLTAGTEPANNHGACSPRPQYNFFNNNMRKKSAKKAR